MAAKETENEIVLPQKKPGRLSLALDKKFHFLERGSNLGTEIGAGIGAAFLTICAILVNTQLIGQAYGGYAGSYLAITLIALLGTVLVGLIANLPLVVTANMGLSTVLISMMSAQEGLTYANLMAVTFVAAIVYLAIILTPAKKVFIEAIPAGVKKALGAGTGLYIIGTSLRSAGIIGENGAPASASSLTTLDRYYFWLMIAATLIFILFKALKVRKTALTVFGILIGCMWIGGICFFLEYFMGGQTASVIVYQRLNVFFATDGAKPYNLAAGIAGLQIAKLFGEGFDFSGFTAAGGSVPALFIKGILVFVFTGLYANMGITKGTAMAGGYDGEDYEEESSKKALLAAGIVSLIAPIFGAPPVTVSNTSAAGANDGGKSGLTSLAASVLLFITLFTWFFIAIFATGTHGVGMWIEETETKLAAYVTDTFAFADLIMAMVGAVMLKGIAKVDFKERLEWIPFLAAFAAIAFLGDFVLAAALGLFACVMVRLTCSENKVKVNEILLTVILLVISIITLM